MYPKNIFMGHRLVKHFIDNKNINFKQWIDIDESIYTAQPIGTFKGSRIYASIKCPQNALYLTPENENVGRFCVGYYPTLNLDKENSNEETESWIISAYVGFLTRPSPGYRILINDESIVEKPKIIHIETHETTILPDVAIDALYLDNYINLDED
jgi:hypothetical protein